MTSPGAGTPVIGITSGDPSGIGPEVIRAALESGKLPSGFRYEVIGEMSGHTAGRPTEAGARAAAGALETAATKLLSGEWQAVVTGPVSKKALHEVGYDFPGQTEFFAARAGVEDFAMCLTGGGMTVALVTAHVPLAQVAGLLRAKEIVRIGHLLSAFLRQCGHECPRIAVAGFNPHAGEGGDLGREEIEVIAPAVRELEKDGQSRFSGPHPPDTIFQRAVGGDFDGVLCMYHDQGLIPLKFHAFDQGVNVTLGLPFVRTSPDHGTAFGIAGQGMARPDSMIAAIQLAAKMLEGRG
ncbi:MAG: 4-hydroxythreonine-4-phosphate dehydrogenase PdxA [Terrimicrobiaceae bacterium]